MSKGPWGKTVSRYNEHGDAVEVVMRDPKGNLLVKAVRLYAYDEHGNWTRIRDLRTTLVVGDRLVMTPYEFTDRAIEYFEDEGADSKTEEPQ
jgi:hypothetical protein